MMLDDVRWWCDIDDDGWWWWYMMMMDVDGWFGISHELLLGSWQAPWPSWHWHHNLPSFIDLAII